MGHTQPEVGGGGKRREEGEEGPLGTRGEGRGKEPRESGEGRGNEQGPWGPAGPSRKTKDVRPGGHGGTFALALLPQHGLLPPPSKPRDFLSLFLAVDPHRTPVVIASPGSSTSSPKERGSGRKERVGDGGKGGALEKGMELIAKGGGSRRW